MNISLNLLAYQNPQSLVLTDQPDKKEEKQLYDTNNQAYSHIPVHPFAS